MMCRDYIGFWVEEPFWGFKVAMVVGAYTGIRV